ncbi:excisionase [Clostridium sp. YIM B02551]|uniref:excisionase n=1 Tax=Clostridium sp. YIM B02551 TaxID=2910679 RepID=UPI001EEB8FC4|nr:excisionase [Clostridium sp. YIM B02551]
MKLDRKELKELVKEAILEVKSIEKLTLTIRECAELTGIGQTKLRELANDPMSGFPVFKINSKFMVNKELLSAWLEKISLEKKVI